MGVAGVPRGRSVHPSQGGLVAGDFVAEMQAELRLLGSGCLCHNPRVGGSRPPPLPPKEDLKLRISGGFPPISRR